MPWVLHVTVNGIGRPDPTRVPHRRGGQTRIQENTGHHPRNAAARTAAQETVLHPRRHSGGRTGTLNPQPRGRTNPGEATREDTTSRDQLRGRLAPEDPAQEQEDPDEGAEKKKKTEEPTMSWSISCQRSFLTIVQLNTCYSVSVTWLQIKAHDRL